MKKKILIVDDEELIRNMLSEVFRKYGYDVQTAETAEKALEILSDEKIQVMYLDLKLPGMKGNELCKLIRKDNPLAIIYAVTGYADMFGLLECRRAGFDDFFNKPVPLKLLLASAQEAFEKLERWQVDL